MQYRFVDGRIKRRTNASTSCENIVKIGSVGLTLEFKKGVCGIFATIRQKLAYPTEYLSRPNSWTDYIYIYLYSPS